MHSILFFNAVFSDAGSFCLDLSYFPIFEFFSPLPSLCGIYFKLVFHTPRNSELLFCFFFSFLFMTTTKLFICVYLAHVCCLFFKGFPSIYGAQVFPGVLGSFFPPCLYPRVLIRLFRGWLTLHPCQDYSLPFTIQPQTTQMPFHQLATLGVERLSQHGCAKH